MWMFLGLITLIGSYLIVRAARRGERWYGQARQGPGGLHYRRLEERASNRRGRLSFGVPCTGGLLLEVQRETDWDRWFRSLGIVREFQTGIREVDDAVYIVAEDPRLEVLFRSNANAARLLRRIVVTQFGGARFDRLICIDGQLSVRFRIEPQFRLESQLAERVLPLMRDLATALESVGGSAESDSSRHFSRKATLILDISLALFVTGLLHSARAWTYPVLPAFVTGGFFWAMCIGTTLMLILILLAWRWLGRSSRAHRVIFEASLAGSVGCLLIGHFLAWQINGLGGGSAPVETRVVDDYTVRAPTPRLNAHVAFPDWPKQGGFVVIEIGDSLYDELRLNRQPLPPLEIDMRRGLLGEYMVHAIRPVVHAEPR